MQLLKEFGKVLKTMTLAIKRWVWVFSAGLAIGIILGQHTTFISIIDDCKVMGMFRVGNAPISCTYHLVTIPAARVQPTEGLKDKPTGVLKDKPKDKNK